MSIEIEAAERRYRDTLQHLNRVEALAVTHRARPRRTRWTLRALGFAHVAHRLAVRALRELQPRPE